MKNPLPFSDIGPIPLFLGFVEISIKVNNKFANEWLSELTSFELFFIQPPIEFKVFLLSDIPSDLSRHINFYIIEIYSWNIFNIYQPKMICESKKNQANFRISALIMS